MKRIVLIAFIVLIAVFLVACGGQEIASIPPTSTATSQPIATQTEIPIPTHTNTPTPLPTETMQPTEAPTETPTNTPTATPTVFSPTLAEVEIAKEAGFSFQPPVDFLVDIQSNQVGIASKDDEILIFIATNPPDAETNLEEVLAGFIQAVSNDAGEITAGEAYPVTIDGKEGIAADISGLFLGEAISGSITIVSPDESLILLAYGLAVNGRWEGEGAPLFDAVMDSISFAMEAEASTEETPAIEPDADFPLTIPVGEPASEWQGIAIMPQAIAGEGDSGGYSFIIEATADEIQSFYENALSNAGWEFLATGDGTTGALLMIFQKGDEVASVSIIPVNDNINYVLIVK